MTSVSHLSIDLDIDESFMTFDLGMFETLHMYDNFGILRGLIVSTDTQVLYNT